MTTARKALIGALAASTLTLGALTAHTHAERINTTLETRISAPARNAYASLWGSLGDALSQEEYTTPQAITDARIIDVTIPPGMTISDLRDMAGYGTVYSTSFPQEFRELNGMEAQDHLQKNTTYKTFVPEENIERFHERFAHYLTETRPRRD